MSQIFVEFSKYPNFKSSQLNSCTVLKKVCTETIYSLQIDLKLHSAVFERCQISLSLTSFKRLEKFFQVFKYFEGHVFSLQPLAFTTAFFQLHKNVGCAMISCASTLLFHLNALQLSCNMYSVFNDTKALSRW